MIQLFIYLYLSSYFGMYVSRTHTHLQGDLCLNKLRTRAVVLIVNEYSNMTNMYIVYYIMEHTGLRGVLRALDSNPSILKVLLLQ